MNTYIYKLTRATVFTGRYAYSMSSPVIFNLYGRVKYNHIIAPF